MISIPLWFKLFLFSQKQKALHVCNTDFVLFIKVQRGEELLFAGLIKNKTKNIKQKIIQQNKTKKKFPKLHQQKRNRKRKLALSLGCYTALQGAGSY